MTKPARAFRITAAALFIFLSMSCCAQTVHFIFTSDVHFGITRTHFRGKDSVASHEVNRGAVAAMNRLPETVLPNDGGVDAGKPIGYIDGIIITGDIANKQEPPVQSADLSWKEFLQVYRDGLHITDHENQPAPLLLTPGNHDVSNAIGFVKPMVPLKDASSMAGIYNIVFHPSISKTASTYDYTTDKINYSKDIGGVHCMSVNMWPDSANRIWMEKDLATVPAATPVLIFMHDPPEADAKQFANPHGAHDINAKDKFENLLSEVYKDADEKRTDAEQRGLTQFFKKHPNIKAYLHGHSNYNEFYTYKGTDSSLSMPVFRADSPMKGWKSGRDETKLSFQLISIDLAQHQLTSRECLWNSIPDHPSIQWGDYTTISF